MNQVEIDHLKRVTDICASRGEAIELLGEKNIKLRAKIDEQAATIATLEKEKELEATISRLTADAKLNDMAWTDNQAALKQITAALEDIKYYVGNPSAWEHYDDGVSEKIRAILKAAGMA